MDPKARKTYSTADPSVSYVYDDLTIPNGRGRLYSVSNSQVTSTINAYDAMGRETSASKIITGDATEYITQYSYDLAGKLKSMTYPDSFAVDYTYHPASGLLKEVIGSDEVYYAKYSDYTPIGQIGRIDYGAYIAYVFGTPTFINYASTDEYTYDRQTNRLMKITTKARVYGNYLQWFEYKYTPAGDIKEKTDNIRGNTYTYLYDKLHRLIEENATGYVPQMDNTTLDYTYDNAYQPHAVKTIALNGTGYNYTYDDNGNMLTGPDFTDPAQVADRTITYNADNMPVSIVHGGTVTTQFVYDGEGARAKKVVSGGSTTYYIGDHYEVKDGAAVKYIFAGNRRIAKVMATDRYFYHKDHLGSSTVMTDKEAVEIEYSDYLPFGHQREHTGTSVTDYKFTDQEYDASSGLYNYDARLYDPVVGRFVSADSIIPDWYDPQALGRYTYARNNPLKYTDPDGHVIQLVVPAVITTAVTSAAAVAITFGIFHYGKDIAADAGKWLGQKIFHEAEKTDADEEKGGESQENSEDRSSETSDNISLKKSKIKNKDRRKLEQKKAKEQKHGDEDWEEPASEDYAKWKAKQLEKRSGKDARRKAHDEPHLRDRSKRDLDRDYDK